MSGQLSLLIGQLRAMATDVHELLDLVKSALSPSSRDRVAAALARMTARKEKVEVLDRCTLFSMQVNCVSFVSSSNDSDSDDGDRVSGSSKESKFAEEIEKAAAESVEKAKKKKAAKVCISSCLAFIITL